jgi:hypothetical protein
MPTQKFKICVGVSLSSFNSALHPWCLKNTSNPIVYPIYRTIQMI